MKTSIYIATSVDGFIARKNGELDWLPTLEEAVNNEDYGYQDFINSVDALVMGRNTYESVRAFGNWPYEKKPVFVLTNQPIDIPDELAAMIESLTASPEEVIRQLSQRGFHHLYIDGGKTIQNFLTAGLINQLIITRVPILIGSGIPLFGALPGDIKLRNIKTRHFSNGLVQTNYEVLRPAP